MADEPFATLEELQERLDFTMDEAEKRIGKAALEDLSDEARYYGSLLWTGPNTSPRVIRTWVLKAAYRYMKNVEGYIMSRAGMEQVQWTDLAEVMGTASFTPTEIKRIQQLARPVAMSNASTYVYGRYDDGVGRDIRVPVDYGGRTFPLVAKEDPLA